MLTTSEHSTLRAIEARYHELRGKRACLNQSEQAEIASTIRAEFGREPLTNDERSQIEVFEFVNEPPSRYFLYINEKDGMATTWMGENLGSVYFGSPFRSNMGDTRVPVTIRAINGRMYTGTYYKSAGDYARVRVAKG